METSRLGEELKQLWGDKILLDEATLAKAFGVNRITLWRARMAGKLNATLVGRRILYRRDDVERFLLNCREIIAA